MTLGAVLIPVQILVGDLHGLNTLEHQPAKVAAMEGNWETRGNVPLVLFAVPNERERRNEYAIEIPNGASLILKHHAEGVVPGLNQFEGKHPPVAPVFYAFRVMVGMGVAMLALSWLGSFYLWRRGTLPKVVMWGFVAMTFSGWIATLAGWYVTEIGRQPWLVTGVLTTAQAASAVPAAMIGTSLAMYLAIYVVLLVAYISVLFHLAGKGNSAVLGPVPAPRRACNRRSDVDGAHHRQSSADLRRFDGSVDPRLCDPRRLRSRRWHADGEWQSRRTGPYDLDHRPVLGCERDVAGARHRPAARGLPAAHGLILTQLYLPVALMLLGLTLRGVAFEFRVKAQLRYQGAWDWAFVGGSLLTALTQGYMLGRYIMGFQPGFWPEIFAIAAGFGLAHLTPLWVPRGCSQRPRASFRPARWAGRRRPCC